MNDDSLDVTSGRPLSEFEGDDTYRYRVALADCVDEFLPQVQVIAPWMEAQRLTAAIDTCKDLDRGVPDVQGAIVRNAQVRFSQGDNQVDEDQARRLVALCLQYLAQDDR